MTSSLLPERLRFDTFSRMMDDVFGTPAILGMTWTPTVDVKETDKELTFKVELPGLSLDDVNVELNGEVLTISGKREFSKEEKREDYVRIERNYGSFRRAFNVGAVKPESIKASFKDGILSVTVPQVKAISPARIPVSAA